MNEGKDTFDKIGWDLLRHQLQRFLHHNVQEREIWPTLKSHAMRMLKVGKGDLEEWTIEQFRQQGSEGIIDAVDTAKFFLDLMDQFDGIAETSADRRIIRVTILNAEMTRLQHIFEMKSKAEGTSVTLGIGVGNDEEVLIRYFMLQGADYILEELNQRDLDEAIKTMTLQDVFGAEKPDANTKKGAEFWGHKPNLNHKTTECTDWHFDAEYSKGNTCADPTDVDAYNERINAGIKECGDCLWNDPPCVHKKGESKGETLR